VKRHSIRKTKKPGRHQVWYDGQLIHSGTKADCQDYLKIAAGHRRADSRVQKARVRRARLNSL
jgi:hypothetical protein